MLQSTAIRQIPVDSPQVYAFRIAGEVSAADMKAMATTMNAAFDLHPSVSMLLIFEHYEGTETGAGLDIETISSQFRALAKVDKYAVVGAPSAAATMIRVMDKIIPTDARTFAAGDEPAAWAFVGAHPI
jgi:hypothetical protein